MGSILHPSFTKSALSISVCAGLLAAGVAAGAGGGAGAAAGSPRPIESAPEPAPTNSGRIDPAVESLVAEYGISVGEATAQMENQKQLDIAVTNLPAELKSVYSGAQIHHDVGGTVTIAAVDGAGAARLSDHLSSEGVRQIATLIVDMNDEELERAAEQLAQHLVKNGYDISQVSVQRSNLGEVTVEVVDASTRADVESELSSFVAERQAEGVYRTIVVPAEPTAVEDASCDRTGNIECDPPLRGSVWMSNPTWNGTVCSAGYNATSRSDGLPYVITAGHCPDDWWYSDVMNETDTWIGWMHNRYDDYWQDSGIIRVWYATTWQFGQPWITVNPNYGGHTANDTYVINAVALPSLGGRVCLTAGNYAATTCGTVDSTSSTASNTAYLFRTTASFCARPGDSGSPVFSMGVAYGIHVASTSGANCGERTWSEQAIDAQNWLNVDIVTS